MTPSRRLTAALVAVVCIGGACAKDLGQYDPPEPYSFVPVPAVPDRTAAIDPAWVEDNGETLGTEVADGRYWATATGVGEGERPFVSFDLSQALFGPTCTAVLGPDGCANDYGVVAEPHGELPAFVADLATVTVVDERQRNYAIDGTELRRLVAGQPPSAAAPAGYAFVAFPFLVTVDGGRIVKAEQIWVP